MLDVHPPHAPTHTWRDFFLHIATIVVGLLIAIGLEETVEAIRSSRERTDLRAALDEESAEIVHSAEDVIRAQRLRLHWLDQVESQLSDATLKHQPVGVLPTKPGMQIWDVPDNPRYNAAKASGRLALLKDDEVTAYGELDSVLHDYFISEQRYRLAGLEMQKVTSDLGFGLPPDRPLLANATPDQIRRYHAACVELRVTTRSDLLWSETALGAARALESGERNLHRIQEAERAANDGN